LPEPDTEVFLNRVAAVPWAVAACFAGAVALQSARVALDGAPAGWTMPVMLALLAGFWLVTAGMLVWAARSAFVTVEVGALGPVRVSRRYPLRRESLEVPRAAVGAAALETDDGSDGGYYYRASFALPDGKQVVLVEGQQRSDCLAACARFNAALGRGG